MLFRIYTRQMRAVHYRGEEIYFPGQKMNEHPVWSFFRSLIAHGGFLFAGILQAHLRRNTKWSSQSARFVRAAVLILSIKLG